MIDIDMGKAKEIGHDIRRKMRDEEFAPLDVQVTIPAYAAKAEAERQKVREKYAEIQSQIDAAIAPEQIKEALGL